MLLSTTPSCCRSYNRYSNDDIKYNDDDDDDDGSGDDDDVGVGNSDNKYSNRVTGIITTESL